MSHSLEQDQIFHRPLICDVTPMHSRGKTEKYGRSGGCDSPREAQFETKSSERVCKLSLDGAAPGFKLIQHNRCLSSFISSFERVLFIFPSTDWTILNQNVFIHSLCNSLLYSSVSPFLISVWHFYCSSYQVLIIIVLLAVKHLLTLLKSAMQIKLITQAKIILGKLLN